MTRSLPIVICLLMAFNYHSIAQSDLFVDTSYTAEEMVNAFFADSDVIPSNVSFTGSDLAYGFFDAGDTDMDINAGIFLSTGNVMDAPNTAEYFASTSLGAAGDLDLESQVNDGFPSHDAAVLEMDITPFSDTICFFYVFASEEYPEWVFTNFNDVFAFMISGGPEYSTLTNISTIPDSDPPVAVSINTVNQHLFSNYYIPQYTETDTVFNSIEYFPDTDLAYDGMTVLLPAKAYVTPGETYHIKIGITDVSDGVFDSGVFIGVESLGGDSLLTPIANAELTVIGDSLAIANESMFAKSFEWDFGDGHTSSERHPGSHVYDEPGDYTVELTVSSWCCSATFTKEVSIGAIELNAGFSSNHEIACDEAEVSFSDLSTGNIVSWEWSFPGGIPASSNEQNPVVLYETPGQYDVSLIITDQNGTTSTIEENEYIQIIGSPVAAFEVTSSELEVALINLSEYGTAYEWDFGNGDMSTEETPSYIYPEPGNYTITLSVFNECGIATMQNELSIVVNSTTVIVANDNFVLYPNPIINELSIDPNIQSAYDLYIYSTDGKMLYQKSGLKGEQNLSLSNLESGVYLLKIESEQTVFSQLINRK